MRLIPRILSRSDSAKDFFTTDSLCWRFGSQHPDGPTVFTQILLTATYIWPFFTMLLTAAYAAQLV